MTAPVDGGAPEPVPTPEPGRDTPRAPVAGASRPARERVPATPRPPADASTRAPGRDVLRPRRDPVAAFPLAERHLLWQTALEDEEFASLLESAERLSGPGGRRPLLAGLRLGMLFLNPSLRTRTSFSVACLDLGAHAVDLSSGQGLWGLERRRGVVMDGDAAEHVIEAIGVLGTMLDGLGVRSFASLRDAGEDAADAWLAAVADAASIPVLNLESALDHPHQGLADALTVRRHVGERVKIALTWAPHVKPLPMAVPHAALLAFAREGHDVVLARPNGFDLDPGILDAAREMSERSGGSLDVTADRDAALAGAQVVYAKAWGSRRLYGDPAKAAAAVRGHGGWKITADDLAVGDDARFMHCLPVRRGVVVDDAVLDGPASLVRAQAAARLDVQKATLCRAFGVES